MPDSRTLVILIAAMVAGVVCFRLFTVLGRRTGQEPQARPAATPLTPPAAVGEPNPLAGAERGVLGEPLARPTVYPRRVG